MNYFIDAFKRYADFSGISTITEYWMFILFNMFFVMAAYLLSLLLLFVGAPWLATVILVLMGIYSFAVIVPSLAIMVRRLRDAGKDWAWIFISFVPVVGGIWLIVLLCQPSVEQTQNRVNE